MRKLFLLAFIILSIVIIQYVFFKIKNTYDYLTTSLISCQNTAKIYEREANLFLRQHSELDSISLIFQNYEINANLEVKDIWGNSKGVDSILTKNKIVIYYPENVCKDCMKYEIDYIKNLIQSGHNEKFVLLGEFSSKAHFKRFVDGLGFNLNAIYLLPKDKLLGNGNTIWLVLIDEKLKIKKIVPFIKNNYSSNNQKVLFLINQIEK